MEGLNICHRQDAQLSTKAMTSCCSQVSASYVVVHFGEGITSGSDWSCRAEQLSLPQEKSATRAGQKISHRHASHFGILAEEVLVGDAGSCYVYGLRGEPLLHFNSLQPEKWKHCFYTVASTVCHIHSTNCSPPCQNDVPCCAACSTINQSIGHLPHTSVTTSQAEQYPSILSTGPKPTTSGVKWVANLQSTCYAFLKVGVGALEGPILCSLNTFLCTNVLNSKTLTGWRWQTKPRHIEIDIERCSRCEAEGHAWCSPSW